MVVSNVTLFNSSFVGSSAGTAMQWQGGRTCLSIVATAYGSGVFFQGLLPDGNTWLTINSGALSANQFTTFDLPRGQYRIISNASSSIGINAILSTVPY